MLTSVISLNLETPDAFKFWLLHMSRMHNNPVVGQVASPANSAISNFLTYVCEEKVMVGRTARVLSTRQEVDYPLWVADFHDKEDGAVEDEVTANQALNWLKEME